MIKFWINKIREKIAKEEQELKTLDKEFKKLVATVKPKLAVARRANLKKTLLATIKANAKAQSLGVVNEADLLPSSLQKLGSQVSGIGQQLKLPFNDSASLKERLIGLIEGGFVTRPSHVFGFKAIFSGALLVVFVISTVMVFPIQIPVSYAHGTYLSELYGDVYVLRDSGMLKGKAFLDLQEGDVILTKEKSFASIHFFDDSLGRLSENTNLQIRRLYTEPLNPLVTQVDLFLKQGHMWARVVNLIGENSTFAVGTDQAQATVAKKAAFDIADVNNSTTLSVFDNVVDVSSADKVNGQSKTVVAGYQAQIMVGNPNVALQALSQANLASADFSPWVAANLSRDTVYDQKLAQDKETLLKGEDDGTSLNGPTSDLNNVGVLTDPDIETAKQNFMQAYLQLKKGETMLVRGLHKEGIEGLGFFRAAVKNIVAKMPEFRIKDQFNADLLQSIVEEKIALQLKDLAAFLPGDRLYIAKDSLQQLQILISQGEVAQTEVKLSQAEGKLLEMQGLIKSNKLDLALTVLHNYQIQMDQFVVTITPDNFAEFKDKLSALVDQQVQQIKVLTSIEQSFNTPESAALRGEVKTVRYQTLLKLINALDKLDGLIPMDLLLELKDVVDTYMNAGTKDDGVVRAAFNRLLNNYVNNIKAKNIKVPRQLGVLLIVTQDASGDAKGGLSIQNPDLQTVHPSANDDANSAPQTFVSVAPAVAVQVDLVTGLLGGTNGEQTKN